MKTLNEIMAAALQRSWVERKKARGFDTPGEVNIGDHLESRTYTCGIDKTNIRTLGTRSSPSDVRSTVKHVSLNTRADFGVVSGERLTTREAVSERGVLPECSHFTRSPWVMSPVRLGNEFDGLVAIQLCSGCAQRTDLGTPPALCYCCLSYRDMPAKAAVERVPDALGGNAPGFMLATTVGRRNAGECAGVGCRGLCGEQRGIE